MKRFSSLLKGKAHSSSQAASGHESDSDSSPDGIATRCVRSFCESGSASNSGDEVSYLPTIVETAESSPTAAAACAKQIRTYLSNPSSTIPGGNKDKSKPHVQYNAIMLIRILADNPGPTFTRNFDTKFVATVKECLRHSRDPSVQTLLRETLSNLESKAGSDPHLSKLLQMWDKEKTTQPSGRYAQQVSVQTAALNQYAGGHNPYAVQPLRPAQLPPPAELAARIEEARTTAKLLIQLTQSTPAEEIESNELLREFADRCQSAQRSLQGFMNLGPDADTFQTLIETNEQLGVASSRYQRALLASQRTKSVDRASFGRPVGDAGAPSLPSTNATGTGAPTLPNIPPVAAPNGDSHLAQSQVLSTPPLQLRTRNPYADVPRLRQPSPRSSLNQAQSSGYASDLQGLDLNNVNHIPDYTPTATGFPPQSSFPTAQPALTSVARSPNGGPISSGTPSATADVKARAEQEVAQGQFEPPRGPPPKKKIDDDEDDLYGEGSPVNPFIGKGEGRVRDP